MLEHQASKAVSAAPVAPQMSVSSMSQDCDNRLSQPSEVSNTLSLFALERLSASQNRIKVHDRITPPMTRTGRIVESGEESADSPEALQREFRDDGINRDIDMEFRAGYISIPPSYAFERRLDTLPVELLLAICLYLDVGSLVRFAYVCKHFYVLAQRTLPSLNLDRLLSDFVSSVSGFKRQLMLSGLAAWGWDDSVSSCIGEKPRCQVFCRTLGDGYDIAIYLSKFEKYSTDLSSTTTMDLCTGHLFRMVRAAFQSGMPFELERYDGEMVVIDWGDKFVGSRGSSLLHWKYSWGLEQVSWTGFLGDPSKSCLLHKRHIAWEDGKAAVRGCLVDILLCGSSSGRFLWVRFSAERWSPDLWNENEDIVREGKEYFNSRKGGETYR
ncbi:uncharacterized protein LY89DRAFT_725865 [Mollisia scopiformis]|uniref:F-box domain-containing protein n=1 Tax=Mollisia scopiformis TaxID=149040 RepID=A0A132B6R5_MOLSC|nr:uncharacterized protein LY89DRAFT_725865 [Mollisia scopiformis]KUJ07367.1 hypothetical protein LY89DRAFT_725865 [Mollisia scopiformis]